MTRSIIGSNVAVVGGAGFLGSHLTHHLIKLGCNVWVIDNLEIGRREFIHPKAHFIYADICQSESYLYKVFKQEAIRFTFNYAARPYVPDSYSRPLKTFEVNVLGAMQVINAAYEAGCEAILQVSSAEVYGDHAKGHDDHCWWTGGIIESFPVIPHSSYGASKGAIDAYCQVAWKERGVPVIALRQFNCVGERETHPYVVPEIISQLAQYLPAGGDWPRHRADVDCDGFLCSSESRPDHYTFGPVVKLGNNSARDFMYAGDAVQIAALLAQGGRFGEVYNLGSEQSVKIYDLALLVGKIMGFRGTTVEADESRARKWEIWHLQSDNTKIKEATNYIYPEMIPLEEALRRTVSWYREQGNRWPWERYGHQEQVRS